MFLVEDNYSYADTFFCQNIIVKGFLIAHAVQCWICWYFKLDWLVLFIILVKISGMCLCVEEGLFPFTVTHI